MSHTSNRRTVAAGIRLRLAAAGQTQAALAAHMGRNETTMSYKMNGRSAFNTDELAAIAEFFNIELWEVLQTPTLATAA